MPKRLSFPYFSVKVRKIWFFEGTLLSALLTVDQKSKQKAKGQSFQTQTVS
jgi:hypothetical protein